MRMRTLVIWLGILWGALAFGGSAWATAQIPDELVYEGEKYMLFTEPLESYWGPSNPRPRFVPPHTANWRGYTASWEIAGGVLYLTGLRGQIANPDGTFSEATLAKFFPGQKGRVGATWFSGTLRVPQGEQLQYVHMGYESTYERDLCFRIQKGKVLESYVIDNTVKKESR